MGEGQPEMAAGAPTRRTLEAVLFVAAWMILGFGLRLGANSYLLVGLPLTAAFQRFVRRQAIRASWLRTVAEPRLDRRWAILTALLAAFPGYTTVRALHSEQFVIALWGLAAVLGAGAAAFALRNAQRRLGTQMLQCLATAGLIGIAFIALSAASRAPAGKPPHLALAVAARHLLLYFPVCFTLEEVTFRGVLDAYLAPDGRGTWASAVLVSALWGVWHLPIIPTGPHLSALPGLLLVHVAVGVPLSMAWRRSGNLAVPALAHSVIDAVRNALLGTA